MHCSGHLALSVASALRVAILYVSLTTENKFLGLGNYRRSSRPLLAMAWVLVTPASRGIGLALTRQLLRATPKTLPIVATARSNLQDVKSEILDGMDDAAGDRLDMQKVDFDNEASIADCATYCKERYNNKTKDKQAHLRTAFMIPGILIPERAPDKIEYDSALATLKMNLLSPLMLVKYFAPFLPGKSTKLEPMDGLNDSAVMALMSARVGSISDNQRGGWYSYRSSKAGVNQLVKSLDIFLRNQSGSNAMAIGLHPGTVKTGLSKDFWESTPKEKLFSPEFAAECLTNVVKDMKDSGRGKCWDWQSKEIEP